MNAATLDDYRWLTSAEGLFWQERLVQRGGTLLQQTKWLRRQLTASQTHLLLELQQLRRRAEAKFDQAAQMYFSARGLEQASDQWVAACKAARFAACPAVADLCCGIGGDLLSLAAVTQVTGIDLDPVQTLLAQVNCQVLGRTAQVQAADAMHFDLAPFAAWHADPDRRPSGRRTTHTDWSAPPTAVLDHWLQQVPHAAIKCAPAAELPAQWVATAERQWIGSGRECKQQVAWFGDLARHVGLRSVVVVDRQPVDSQTLVGQADTAAPVAASLGSYIIEPHAAVRAARLTGVLAAAENLEAVDPGLTYLTADHLARTTLASCFQILDTLPLDLKRIRRAVQALEIGRLEVKTRGVAVDPHTLQRKLQGEGHRDATLIITPCGGRTHALLCQRCAP